MNAHELNPDTMIIEYADYLIEPDGDDFFSPEYSGLQIGEQIKKDLYYGVYRDRSVLVTVAGCDYNGLMIGGVYDATLLHNDDQIEMLAIAENDDKALREAGCFVALAPVGSEDVFGMAVGRRIAAKNGEWCEKVGGYFLIPATPIPTEEKIITIGKNTRIRLKYRQDGKIVYAEGADSPVSAGFLMQWYLHKNIGDLRRGELK